MTDDEVLTALDAFIAGFGTTDRRTQEPRSPNSKGETLIDKDSQKERKEREKEDGSREDPYIQDLGTLGSNTQKPRHSCGFRWSPRGAHEAPNRQSCRLTEIAYPLDRERLGPAARILARHNALHAPNPEPPKRRKYRPTRSRAWA
jgi:hypothetical protein